MYTWKYDKALRDQRRQGTTPPVDLWPAVRQITIPTLILRGADSDIFAVETAQRMQACIPGSQFVEIPRAGHAIPADAPEAFEKAVRDFVTMS
jgi:pimeloyl-ACP methyl ester carboxylesterase